MVIRKRTKEQTTIYKTLHRKLTIKQHEPPLKTVNELRCSGRVSSSYSSFMTYQRVCNQVNTMGFTSRAGTVYLSGAPEFTPGFQWGSCYSIFSFICMFCRSLFVLLYFFFWTLCCLFFFDIRILIAPLVSSNSSIPHMPHVVLLSQSTVQYQHINMIAL